jgi:hypothetical protein
MKIFGGTKMKKLVLFGLSLMIITYSYANETVTELLDEAQNSLKMAFESQSDKKAPYEYSKALTFYEIAQEETSKLNIEAGKAAALESIEWSLRAISKSYTGGEK